MVIIEYIKKVMRSSVNLNTKSIFQRAYGHNDPCKVIYMRFWIRIRNIDRCDCEIYPQILLLTCMLRFSPVGLSQYAIAQPVAKIHFEVLASDN